MPDKRSREYRERFIDSLAPPDRRPMWEWAAEHVNLPGVLTVTGKFQPNLSRHLLPVFDALQNHRVRKVVLMKPVRGAGSLIADIRLPWIVKNDPGFMVRVFHSDRISKDHSEDRIQPILRGCIPARELFPDDRHQARIQEIKFRNGMPFYINGPSIGNLQSKGVRYLDIEELWCWDNAPSRYAQALARIGDFEEIGMSKVFIISQAGVKDDPLDIEWCSSDQREWFVPCLGCGKEFEAKISARREDGTIYGLRWDDNERTRDKTGRWIPEQLIKTVRYECQHCGHAHADEFATKARWNLAGRYIAQNGSALPSNVGFHFSAIIFRSWASLADELSRALNAYKSGLIDPIMEFTKKRDARSWNEGILSENRKTITYEITEKWAEEKTRIATIDCQMEGVKWMLIVAWGTNKARRLWYGKLYSEAEMVAKIAEYKVEPFKVGIDSRYDTKDVYRMCVRQGWRALRGMDRDEFLHTLKVNGQMRTVRRSYSEPSRGDPEIGTTHQGRRFATIIKWSNLIIKNRVQGMLDKSLIEEPRLDPLNTDEIAYAKQMKGHWRRLIRDRVTQKSRFEWHGNKDDHARDCWCEQAVIATILKLLPDQDGDEPVDSPQPLVKPETYQSPQ